MVLKYDDETERFSDLHCGEMIYLKVNDKFIEVRIELSGICKKENWYFIDENGFTSKCIKHEGCEIKEK